MKGKTLWKFLRDIATQWFEDGPFQLAAALSYYTLFSLAPILIIAIALAGLFFGREAAGVIRDAWRRLHQVRSTPVSRRKSKCLPTPL